MRISVEQVKAAAKGKWVSILEMLQIDIPPNGQHGPCPICGGKDRFRMSDRNGDGDYICGQHGAGDGIDLVRQCLGLDFVGTLAEISRIVAGGLVMDAELKSSTYDPREMLNRVWQSSQPLTGSDPVSRYLHSRGIVRTPEGVRYCPECYESDTKRKMPAMVARLVDVDGKPVSLHRTYLNGIGKADIKSPKKLMKGIKPLSGSAIRLFPPKNNTIGIAEGIETAISAYQVTEIPCWSAVGTALLKGFDPPQGIRKVVIFADADPNFAGQSAAYQLANKLYCKDLLVEVELPPMGKDWNDYLIEISRKEV